MVLRSIAAKVTSPWLLPERWYLAGHPWAQVLHEVLGGLGGWAVRGHGEKGDLTVGSMGYSRIGHSPSFLGTQKSPFPFSPRPRHTIRTIHPSPSLVPTLPAAWDPS